MTQKVNKSLSIVRPASSQPDPLREDS